MTNNVKEEKISLKKLVSNVLYVYKYANKNDKKLGAIFLVSECIREGTFTFIETFILKAIIDVITNGADLKSLLFYLVVQFVLFSGALALFLKLDSIFYIRLVKVSGSIQRELMAKAQMIDLKCYDIPDYYDDFVIAAAQSDDMITRALQCVARIAAYIFAMIIAGAMVFTITPFLAIFPVLGFIINIISRFAITKQEFKYEIEKQKIGRKADYSKRVFYQPEYAKEIKLTGIEEALMEQFDEAVIEEKQMAKKYGLKIALLSLVNWIGAFTMFQFFAVPVYLAYKAIVKKSISLGDVASLSNAINGIQQLLDGLNYALIDFQKVGQYAERFRRFMDYEINIEGFEGKTPVPLNDCTLELKNVSFKYKDTENYVINNISMTIKKGEKVALVGENGAGKTTLIKLIMRLYDVTDGSITFGGVDIRELNTKEYRQKIGTVFQDFQIFGATLAENVKTDFTDENDSEYIVTALKHADFGSKLESLSDGINTELTKEFSDNGTMLSGGEAQKTAISRMFMRVNMPIAILDEPSSALDPIAEYRLNKSMMKNAENQAVILISHRLSTTKDADRIILLENGSIAECGNHSELLEKNGQYAEMWNVQAEKYCMKIYA